MRGRQVYCIFLFLAAASLFGTIIAQVSQPILTFFNLQKEEAVIIGVVVIGSNSLRAFLSQVCVP